jgi:hypothetical protein
VSIDNGVGVRDIFGMVWGSIEIIISLEKLLYNGRHPQFEAYFCNFKGHNVDKNG